MNRSSNGELNGKAMIQFYSEKVRNQLAFKDSYRTCGMRTYVPIGDTAVKQTSNSSQSIWIKNLSSDMDQDMVL